MIVLTTSTSNQSFVITQRRDSSIGVSNKINFTDKETNVTITENIISTTTYDLYDTIQVNVALLEGHMYRMEMYKDTIDDLRFRGLCFCTDQIDSSEGFANVEAYTINKDIYTENQTTNEFTILE